MEKMNDRISMTSAKRNSIGQMLENVESDAITGTVVSEEVVEEETIEVETDTGEIPEGDVVYDATEIIEMTEFDMGDDDVDQGIANNEEITSDQLSVWPDELAVPSTSTTASTSSRGRGRPKGRQVVHIVAPRKMPHREARVQSFKNLVDPQEQSHTANYEEEDEGVGNEGVSRVFISNDVPGMHLEWPLFSQVAESFSTAATIILTSAAGVDPGLICTTVPSEFTQFGTFIINMDSLSNRHELTLDGLGSWGPPQGSAKYFDLNESTQKAVVAHKDSYAMKILCNRYTHPGTDERGRFFKKTYTGVSRDGVPSEVAVVMYEWVGVPHPIAVDVNNIKQAGHLKDRAFGSRVWESEAVDLELDEGHKFRSLPIFSIRTIDFESACKILLANIFIPVHRICVRMPMRYTDCGTFVVDLARCGGDRALNDGRHWCKPSGSSRYYSFDDAGNAVRIVNKHYPAHAAAVSTHAPTHYDVQVICRRYETEERAGLVRKIFVAKERTGHRVNSHLSVVTYLYRPIQENSKVSAENRKTVHGGRLVPQKRKLCDGGISIENDVDEALYGRRQRNDMLERKLLSRQMENQLKMTAALDTAEMIFDRMESGAVPMDHLRQAVTGLGVIQRVQFSQQGLDAPSQSFA